MLRLFPPSAEPLDPNTIYDDLELPQPGPDRSYVLINMVSTVDGKVALRGRAAGLGSAVDHVAMRKLRAVVDAVVNGAGTLRREHVNPTVPPALEARRVALGLTPQPVGVLMSGSLDVPSQKWYFQARPGYQAVVFTGRQGDPERARALAQHARVIVAGDEEPEFTRVLEILRTDFGARRVLVEGGPRLNQSLLSAGLADELFVTLAPKLLGGPALSLVEGDSLLAGAPVQLDLVSALHHESELFLRYRIRSVSAA
ncbi:MAG: dihydrofolate reductase family protein [Chloroflexi bacterium]|nr:dihydrofolate reductase family protein [Chloroflexota bacterium]